MTDTHRATTLVVLATTVFWIALAAFGAARPDYSQLTKAVSELGAVGAPHALAWNVIGFVVPGLLLAAGGLAIATVVDRRRRSLRWLLAGSGLAFAATGVLPAVMQHGSPVMQAPSTVGHIVMLLLSSAFWLAAIGVLLVNTSRDRRMRWLLTPLLITTVVSLAGFAANVLHGAIPWLAHRPGLAQRLGFAGYFFWYVSLSLAPTMSATQQAHTRADQSNHGTASREP